MNKGIKEKDFYVQEFDGDSENEIDILEILKKIWRNKIIILIFFITGIVISFIGGKIYKRANTVTRTGIALNFEEIKNGKNPDGTTFEVQNLLPTKVLRPLYTEYKKILNRETDFTDFQNYIIITPIIPKNISILIEKNLKEGVFYAYTPTEYFINLNSEISSENEKLLLEKLIRGVLDEYILKYRPFSLIPTIEVDKLLSKDFTYEDYLSVIKSAITSVENNIDIKDTKKMKYSTSSLNYDYRDILLSLDLIKSIELNKIEAKLDLRYISSNIEKSNALLNQQLLALNIDKQILIKRSEILKERIDNYKVSNKELVLPDSMNIALPEKEDFYAKLIENYVETSTQIEANNQEIKKLEKKLTELRKSDEVENNNIIEELKSIITLINSEIIRLNELNKKYYETEYSNMIIQISPVENIYVGKPTILFIAIGGVLSFIFGCIYVLLREALKDKKEEK